MHLSEQQDFLTGKAAVEATQGYEPMANPLPPPPAPEADDPYRGITAAEAAQIVVEGRNRPPETESEPEPEPVTVRQYWENSTGEPSPDNQSIDIRKASDDLA